MNAASILGRTIPNFLADKYGPLNGKHTCGAHFGPLADAFAVLIVSGFITGGLIFSLFGATNVGGVTAFAIVYGFFSGGCKSFSSAISNLSSLLILVRFRSDLCCGSRCSVFHNSGRHGGPSVRSRHLFSENCPS